MKEYLDCFIRQNYTGPQRVETMINENVQVFKDSETKERWILDGEEIVENIKFCSLLYYADRMLNYLQVQDFPSVLWWKIRVYFQHQNCLEEKSTILWTSIKTCVHLFEQFLQNPGTTISSDLLALYYTELSQIYSYYYDTESAKKYISKVKDLVGLSTSAIGELLVFGFSIRRILTTLNTDYAQID